MGPIVAIVGRPNVGKSAFFNRMIKNRQAIVHSETGVTRDRHYGKSFWNGVEFTLIDTGGYLEGSDDIFQKEIDKDEAKDLIKFRTHQYAKRQLTWFRKNMKDSKSIEITNPTNFDNSLLILL